MAAVPLLPAPISGPFGAPCAVAAAAQGNNPILEGCQGRTQRWRWGRGGAQHLCLLPSSKEPPEGCCPRVSCRARAGTSPSSGSISSSSSSSSFGESMPGGCRAAAVRGSLQQRGAAPAPQGGNRPPQPSEPHAEGGELCRVRSPPSYAASCGHLPNTPRQGCCQTPFLHQEGYFGGGAGGFGATAQGRTDRCAHTHTITPPYTPPSQHTDNEWK